VVDGDAGLSLPRDVDDVQIAHVGLGGHVSLEKRAEWPGQDDAHRGSAAHQRQTEDSLQTTHLSTRRDAAEGQESAQSSQYASDDEIGAAVRMDGHVALACLQAAQSLLGGGEHHLSRHVTVDVETPQRGPSHQHEVRMLLTENLDGRMLQRVVAAHARDRIKVQQG
jgi:hypothetical protein